MSKFNTRLQPGAQSPVATEASPSAVTHQGGAGYARDTRSELFLLAVSNMVGEHTFYETANTRDDRYEHLVRTVTAQDPEWIARLLPWLRREANLRSALLVGAAIFAHERSQLGETGMSRQVVDSVLQRADEPGEFLAYWIGTFGRTMPKSVKRGVADAAVRLYDEKRTLKWDSTARSVRFADVLELTHPKPLHERQEELFRHLLDRRFHPDREIPAELEVLRGHAALGSWSPQERRDLMLRGDGSAATVLAEAGMTWEQVAGWLHGPMDAFAWESIIPSMGYMALLRNLRNFDEAGVSDEVAGRVAAKLADPEEVARSRQFPMRFLSAYRAAPNLRWSWALEKAITHSLMNIPELGGRTLILVDTSGSMQAGFSKDGTLMRWDAAVVFGLALASRCAIADVVSFSGGWAGSRATAEFDLRPGESLLKAVERWRSGGFFIGGGTDTEGAVRRHFAGHDRVVILTDEQASYGDVGSVLPRNASLYTWNLAGYRYGHAPSGGRRRHTFGGLSDQAFRMIPLLEAGESARWPF